MSTAATTTTQNAKDKDERVARVDSIFGPEGLLNRHNVERKEAIELLKLSILSGVDTLFLGEPGVGKTWAIELLTEHGFAQDVDLFTTLLAKDMSADDVLGPRSLAALKEDRIARIVEGFLPTAHFGYLDEVFKASAPMLNPLLDLLANRLLKVGGRKLDCSQLIAILMSSNELPEREDLQALRDRIGITYMVEPVKTPEGRRSVTDIQLDFQSRGIDTTGVAPLTLDDIAAIRSEVAMIDVPEGVRDQMCEAQQKWLEAGHPPSQRRIGQMWRVIKAHAWANARTQAGSDDLLPCQHMAFNNLDDRKTAREVILGFASAFTRKGDRLRQAFEPLLQTQEDMKGKAAAAENDEAVRQQMYDTGMKFIRECRQLRKEAKDVIAEGARQGQDVTVAEDVLKQIEDASTWAQKTLIGDDDE